MRNTVDFGWGLGMAAVNSISTFKITITFVQGFVSFLCHI